MPSTPAVVGDRVTIVNTYRVSERHFNGRTGVVDVVLVGSGPGGRTGYRVKLDGTGQLVLTYSIEKISEPATEIVVDVKRAQAFVVAKDALPADSLVSDIVEAARFILGELPVESASTNTVTIAPGALQVGTLAPATDIDADRRLFNEGFTASGVEVNRDHAGDNDLLRISTNSGGSEYLKPYEVEALVAFLQAALRVGAQDGTRPPFPEPGSGTPF